MSSEYKSKKVLIIEDEPINMLIITEMLKTNYLLFHALNSQVAYELTENIKFDAILIDIFLGDDSADGLEIAQNIKQNQPDTCTKIALTSSLKPAEFKTLSLCGFTYYFQKPVSKNELMSAIENTSKPHF